MIDFDPNEVGGGALIVGFLLVLLVLYRNPANGLEAAMVGPQSVLFFLVVPLVGLLAGVYFYKDGPYWPVPLFVLGSYLGVFGLALALGELLTHTPLGILFGVGTVLVSLSVVALAAGILRFASAVGFASHRVESDRRTTEQRTEDE